MCGFAGYFPSIKEETDTVFLNEMLENTKYRGPDRTNIFRNNKIALGHHRLSIIDLNGGKQPVSDKNSGDCLVYNGEIYNFKSQSKFLKKNGIHLKETSDTEVLFNLLTHFGVKRTLERIEGISFRWFWTYVAFKHNIFYTSAAVLFFY